MEVRPFKAFRFDPNVVGDVGSCIAPPYDVIDPSQQAQLCQKSPYNIVRIIKPSLTTSDNETSNQYTRAADCLRTWLEKGVLKQDSQEAIYPYLQDFQLGGRGFQRLGFIALARLEEFGEIVRPHEETFTQPRTDRLNLIRATAAQTGLVFMIYQDQEQIADKIIESAATGQALIDFVDEQKVRHRLFAITVEKHVNAIAAMMADKGCVIADGHHRYETGLIYSRENPKAKYQMMAFVNTYHEGLIVLATHRLIGNLRNFDSAKLIADLKKKFQVTGIHFDSSHTKADARHKILAQMKTEQENNKNAFALYTGDNAFWLAVLKDKNAMDSAAPNMSNAWKSLDVAVLHKLVLEELLGVDERSLSVGNNLDYLKDSENAIDESVAKVDAGQKQAAFFTNPPKIEQIQAVAQQGERMPQKSTYFYPKMYSGLTINKL